jgi:hypothetical protein
VSDLPANIATALGAAFIGVWGDRRLQDRSKNTDLLATVSSLNTGIQAISKELTLIRQEMREDRSAVNHAVDRIFDKINVVETKTMERFSEIEQRTSALEALMRHHD